MKEFIDKLIGSLEEQKGTESDYSSIEGKKLVRHWNNCVDVCKEIVNQLAEEYKGGWIACSERLPEYTDEYNVTVDVASEFGCYRTVKTLRFERIEGKEPKWVMPQDEVYRVIAWKALPAPYTEGE